MRQGLWPILFGTMIFLGMESAWALEVFKNGSPNDGVRPGSQAICLAGGASDDLWAQGWRYLLEKSGGGDVVIIRANGKRGEYEDWIYLDRGKHGFPSVNSVTTLLMTQAEDANLPQVEKAIRNAELVFFAGGSQTIYIDWFKGSRLATAVEYVMNVKKVPVGGTSAGMALLAGIDFKATYGPPKDPDGLVTARDVLEDPTGLVADLDRTVLTAPFMEQVITDTHFNERSRQGRLFGFMARAVHNSYEGISWNTIKGIGADEGTAVCYDSTGVARVYGAGDAYFLQGNAPIGRIRTGASLDWNAGHRAVKAYKISGSKSASASFDLRRWQGVGGVPQYWFVDGSNASAPLFGME